MYKSYSDSKCVVEVSDSDPDPVNFWIQNLNLYDCDLQSLQPNKDVTESVINASQKLLKDQFGICGFQNTALVGTVYYIYCGFFRPNELYRYCLYWGFFRPSEVMFILGFL